MWEYEHRMTIASACVTSKLDIRWVHIALTGVTVAGLHLHLDKPRGGVQVDSLGVLHRPVGPVLSQAGSIVEEAGCNGLLDGVVIPQITHQLNLRPVHQAQQLFPDVSHALHHFDLQQDDSVTRWESALGVATHLQLTVSGKSGLRGSVALCATSLSSSSSASLPGSAA